MSALNNTINTSVSTHTDRSWDLFWLYHSYIILSAQSTGLSQKNIKDHFEPLPPPNLKFVPEQNVLFLKCKTLHVYFVLLLLLKASSQVLTLWFGSSLASVKMLGQWISPETTFHPDTAAAFTATSFNSFKCRRHWGILTTKNFYDEEFWYWVK